MPKKLKGVAKAIKRLTKGASRDYAKFKGESFKGREDLASKAKRKKKMDAEKPRSARRDARKDPFPGSGPTKYRSGGPKGARQLTPEFKTFLKQEAERQDRKDMLKALGAAGATGAGATAAMVSAGKKEAERVKKEQERIKKFQDEKLKSKKKVPVKKAKGGMVTKWENKWG